MNDQKTPVLNGLYRIDIGGHPTLCATEFNHRVAVTDVLIGTEFRTQGSTDELRTQFDVRHACHLTLCFGDRGEAYFTRDNGEHIELRNCADLRLVVCELPYAGH